LSLTPRLDKSGRFEIGSISFINFKHKKRHSIHPATNHPEDEVHPRTAYCFIEKVEHKLSGLSKHHQWETA
jgi:hypothetical protein